MGSSSCRGATTNMKALVVLALVGLAAAKPQYLWYNNPLVTVKPAEEGSIPTINTYTASYPFHTPLVAAAKPAEETPAVSREKRDAEPEPEADPQLIYNFPTTSGLLPTTYTSSGILPTTYTIPSTYTLPTTAGFIPGPYGYSTAYTGLNNPFSYFPFGNPFVAAKAAAEEPAAEAARKKRSADPEADPEADPQFLYNSGSSAFAYPAVNTYTNPLTYTVNPTTFPRLTTTFARPSIYTYPFGQTWG